MIRNHAVLPLAMCMLLAACGGGDTNPSVSAASSVDARPGQTVVPPLNSDPRPERRELPDQGSDACALLAGIDVDAALGEAAGPTQSSPTTCNIKPVDAASPASLMLQYLPDRGATSYAQQNELFGVDAPVAGLGDEAIVTGTRVHARSGERFLRLQIVRNPASQMPQITAGEVVETSRRVAANAGW